MEVPGTVNDTPTPIEFVSLGKTLQPGNEIVGMNGLEECSKHTLLQTTKLHAEIKSEPPEDINDTPCTGIVEEDAMNDSSATNSPNPRIRLTPTIKLMTSPNPMDPKRKFACPYDNCTKSYGKSSHLRSHLTWHTGIKPFVCQVYSCGKGFTRSDELNRHVRTHTGEKPFECVQCTKKFSRSDHLTKHLATHAKQMERDRERIETSSEGRPQKKVNKERQRNDNLGSMHFMESLVENAVRMSELSKTESKSQANDMLIGHAPIKIKLERPVNSEEYHVVPAPPSALQQPHPDASESKDYLSQQLKIPDATMLCIAPLEPKNEPNFDDAIMPEANLPPLPIVSTGFSIPHYEQLAEEVAYDRERAAEEAYGKERPFHCNQCIKCFKRQDDLNRHLRTHSGETPYACSECDRRFRRSDHLKKHLRTHTKVEPGLYIPIHNPTPMPELPVPDLPAPATMT